MLTEQALLLAKSLDRYKDFTYLDNPVKFSSYFTEDYDIVQVHLLSTANQGKNIVGFVGVFSWINGKICSLDYDSSASNTNVYAYQEFTTFDGSRRILEILVDDFKRR